MELSFNESLRKLELPSLTRLEGQTSIQDSHSAPTTSNGFDGTATGSKAPEEDAKSFPRAGALSVTNNPALPTCYATALDAQLCSARWKGEARISGNDDAGSCGE